MGIPLSTEADRRRTFPSPRWLSPRGDMEFRPRVVTQWHRPYRNSLHTYMKVVITQDSIGKIVVLTVKSSCTLAVAVAAPCVIT